MTEIQNFVDGVVDGRLSDSDVEAWMRNVFDNGLSERCLLYTSPSPRDLSTSRMPSSA